MALSTECKIEPQKYYQDYLDHDVRPDGRLLNEYRPVSINVKSLHNADASSIVKIGNTAVVCGIKMELARPKAETPNEGYLVVNVTLPPLCCSIFQPGPPSDLAQTATNSLNETLINSQCIDLKDLCISPDLLCWVLHLDVYCLNYNGGLLDASVMASIAALWTIKFPHVEFNVEDSTKTVNPDIEKCINIKHFPISTSFAVFENKKIVSDPTLEEETLATGIVTVTIAAETGETCSIHQPGTTPLPSDLLQTCISEAYKKAKVVLKLISTAMCSPER